MESGETASSLWNYGQSRSTDRQLILDWARMVVADPYAVYLDTETTGVGGDAEIVDIAVLAGDGQVLLESLVKPNKPIPVDASRIHGIYDEHVASALPWRKIYPMMLDVIAQRRVVVYNADYDLRVIASVSRAVGLNVPLTRWDCAMKAYSSYVGEPSGHSRGGYRWFKLDQAARAFGIEPGGHRAAADAEACRQVVRALANIEQ